MKQLRAIVLGHVQGVTYRDCTCTMARKLRLVGFVRNLPNGTVEIIAEGDEQILRHFADTLREKHPFARVDRIEEEWRSASETFTNFEVRY